MGNTLDLENFSVESDQNTCLFWLDLQGGVTFNAYGCEDTPFDRVVMLRQRAADGHRTAWLARARGTRCHIGESRHTEALPAPGPARWDRRSTDGLGHGHGWAS